MTNDISGFPFAPRMSAGELAGILDLPEPTPEQIHIIEAPLSPALVVAGAGSGKTETMAARVVWLVANGFVSPHQVLGLTFTRKAATSLMKRIRARIDALADRGLTSGDPLDEANIPSVSTYNSFANRLYGQFAIHIGLDPDATIISEATAWQLARSVVCSSLDPDIVDLDKRVNDITVGVLELSRAMNDHIADPDEVFSYGIRMREHFEKIRATYEGARKTTQTSFDSCVDYALSLPVLVRCAQEYDQAKRDRGFIEFSDQVRYALSICRSAPSVVTELREQFRVVLLDEYQDTSVLQTTLLKELFAGSAVMAVGDPHQSIYGWRGASATNMMHFARDFEQEEPARPYPLTVSWRNPRDVLDVANTYVARLSEASPVSVEPLAPRPNAPSSPIALEYFETIAEEAAAVAEWFAERLREAPESASAALLFRATRTMSVFRAALEEAGVPVHVVGLGGLLDEPVIVDLVCALGVIHDATADSQLVRLLAGPRWMIAPRDLVGLRQVARWLSSHNHQRKQLSDDVRLALRASVTNEDSESLIDALDFIAAATVDYSVFSAISHEGLTRLRDAGAFVQRLRQHSSFDLRDLVTFVYEELRLDLEVAANPTAGVARSAFESFLEPVETFLLSTDRPTLGSFLGWLREAERRERLSPVSPPAEAGVVQLMTIHAAKGLEWDHVAIPRLVDKEVPGDRARADTWRKFGALPYAFRGDAHDLPHWAWEKSDDVETLVSSFEEFRERVRDRFDEEERRLIYVGVTRAKKNLLMTGSYWNSQKSPRQPSVFVTEVVGAGLVTAHIPDLINEKENPLGDNALRVPWPADPLGPRRDGVLRAADDVRGADPRMETPWDPAIELLLRERSSATGDTYLPAPARIAASKFKDFVSSPAEVAASVRRPIPLAPFRATLLGTVFHEWVERRFGTASVVPGDLLESLEDEDDPDFAPSGPVDEAALKLLQQTFLSSEWGNLHPIDVEREIHILLDDVSIVCKIDAVFQREQADGKHRIEIVDWKTGRPPHDDADYELKQMQLALYRLAYAQWSGIDSAEIDVAFYFVGDDIVLRPDRVMTEEQLVALWRRAVGTAESAN